MTFLLDLDMTMKRFKKPKFTFSQDKPDLCVEDINFMLRIVNAKWPWTFQVLIIVGIDILCIIEFVLAIAAVVMNNTSAKDLGAAVIDISCMSQIASHVHASAVKRSEVVPAIRALLDVAKVMEESCNSSARKRMRRWAYIVRGITAGTFSTIAVCLLINLRLNRPEGQLTPVATWPAPTADMPMTIALVSTLQLYATVSGSFIFCVASSIHFGVILYTVILFSGLSSCIRCLHLCSDSEEDRYHQLVKYAKCHQSLLGAMFDINRICKSLLFSRVNATFAVLVYTGMSISLGYLNVRVMWMTAFGFGTLLQITVTGQFLKESADVTAEAFYKSHWDQEHTKYQTILLIALMRTIKPLHMSTWFRHNCDLSYFIEFVKSWYSSVQMMYKARTSRHTGK